MSGLLPAEKAKSITNKLRSSRWFLTYHAIRRNLRSIGRLSSISFAKFFAVNGFLSSFYYFLFSREFDREHKSVLSGRIEFYNRLKKYERSNGLLRRNIHRLEKGLIMRPRKPVFALDYIQETIELYEKAIAHVSEHNNVNNEVVWAYNVLQSYFEACATSHLSLPARERFEQVPAPKAPQEIEVIQRLSRIPYKAKDRPDAAVSYTNFLKLAQRRRSVRWFQDRAVEKDKIDQIIDAARLSPSACNRLPYHFLTFTKPDLAQHAAALAGGTGGFATQIPSLIVVLGDLSCYSEERDRHLIYVDASLASMTLMLAAETVGLATCPINWSDVPSREKKMYKFLKDIPQHWRPVMLIAIGYADGDGDIPYSSKKDFSIIRSYDNASV